MGSSNMKDSRIKKGLSMKELSFKTRISERYLYFIEKGEKTPSLKTAQIIANALDASIEDIFLHRNITNDSID